MGRPDDLAERERRHRIELDRYRVRLDAAGVREGALLGCGFSGGCVFEKQGTKTHVYKVLLGIGTKDREVAITRDILTLGEVHPALVKSFGAWTFLRDPAWGETSYSLNVIERERLDFDDDASDAILGVLSTCEAVGAGHGIYSPDALIRRLKPEGVERYVAGAVREFSASGLEDEPPSAQVVKDATRILDGLVWLYRTTGYVLGDLWAVGLGIGYGTKPDNLGWRGRAPVIADLGVWRRK